MTAEHNPSLISISDSAADIINNVEKGFIEHSFGSFGLDLTRQNSSSFSSLSSGSGGGFSDGAETQFQHNVNDYLRTLKKRPLLASIGLYLFVVLFGGGTGIFYYGSALHDSIYQIDSCSGHPVLLTNPTSLSLHIVVLFVFFVFSALLSLLVTWVLVEKYKHEELLCNMLPNKVIRHLETGERVFAESYDNVTIFFSDIVSFTELVSDLSPEEVVKMLDELYCIFDEVALKHPDVYKIETIGDAYMAVCGCPNQIDPIEGAAKMAKFAHDVLDALELRNLKCGSGNRLQIRVGIHSGAVVAGVIGHKMPRFCLFGDTVNTASRMESSSQPMRIHLSAATANLLNIANGDDSTISVESRGKISVKGKGEMQTFWLRRKAMILDVPF